MTLQEIQYKAQGIIHKWRDDDSAPYIEFVEELAHMTVPEPSADLEEAAGKSSTQYYQDAGYSPFPNVETAAHKSGFIAGVQWQKAQFMKEAVEGKIATRVRGKLYARCQVPKTMKAEFGDRVKVIFVKED